MGTFTYFSTEENLTPFRWEFKDTLVSLPVYMAQPTNKHTKLNMRISYCCTEMYSRYPIISSSDL